MADHSITISNSLYTWGVAPSNKWGEFNWNAFLWGEGANDLQVLTLHYIDVGSATPLSAMSISAYFFPTAIANSVTLDTSVTVTVAYVMSISIANTLEPTADMYSETLSDGSGWDYIFPNNTSNIDNKVTPTYTAASDPGTSWSSASGVTSTWSDAA